ncbi:MAG: hypothetical protein JO287_07140 [Pseudonocardiales bacterium]|nr:hypothetical protein [Pseudonocardiales bacterium]
MSWIGDLERGIEHTLGDVGHALDDVVYTVESWMPDSMAHALQGNSARQVTAEKQLGETTDPHELIRSDVNAVHQLSQHLQTLSSALNDTADGLRRIDLDHWTGPAASAFHQAFSKRPHAYIDAADAFTVAATEMTRYAETLTWAQAQHAVALYQQGEQATQKARAEYQKLAAGYHQRAQAWNAAVAAGTAPAGPAPEPPAKFTDPGQATREQAQTLLTAARRQRDEVATNAQHTLTTATEAAPPAPSGWQQFVTMTGDTTSEGLSTLTNFLGGVAEAGEGAIHLIRQINPFDPDNVTHPANYLGGLSDLAAGLVHTAIHPENLITGLAHGWNTNPARALGQLTGNLALGFAGGRIAAVDRDTALTATRSATEDATPAIEPQPGLDTANPDLTRVEKLLADIPGYTPGDVGYHSASYHTSEADQLAFRTLYPDIDEAWLHNIRTRWPATTTIPDENLLALERYTGSGDAAPMNTAARSGNPAQLEQYQPLLRNATSALNQLPDFHGEVSRGINVPPNALPQVLDKYQPGTIVNEPAFTSTSKSQPYSGNVKFVIQSSHGKDISPLLVGQQEVLFPPGNTFVVDGTTFNNMTQQWEIYLTDRGR